MDIPSIEVLKLVNASEMGVVIGMDRAPDKEVIRDHLGKMAQHSDKRRLIKISNLKNSIVEKKKDVLVLRSYDKLSQLPGKVSILDLLKGKSISLCDLEKKKFYDLMQFMAYNFRERLVDIFHDCYSDQRAVKPVLDMITRNFFRDHQRAIKK